MVRKLKDRPTTKPRHEIMVGGMPRSILIDFESEIHVMAVEKRPMMTT